jgi:hypothetical protein
VAQQVFGSFSLLDSGCRTGTFSWNAETTATPPPPPSPAPKCHVPKLVGLRLATARTRVRKAHCAVGRIRYARSATRPPGRVSSQRPRAGAVRPRNTKVNLTVSRR